MANVYENVRLVSLTDDGQTKCQSDTAFKVVYTQDKGIGQINILNGSGKSTRTVSFDNNGEIAKVGTMAVLVSVQGKSVMFRFAAESEAQSFHELLRVIQVGKTDSIFNKRTDAASAEQYFQFYGYLSQQQNMMQDYIRTSTYQRAMLDNCQDFQDKVVLDVGAGSGILSFFAVQAGARKVYAIEASNMAMFCEKLVASNKLSDRIIVMPGKIEEVDLPEKVDIIISEPMGYMLFNERMLETYLHAKKWLKPNGQMFPTQGDLHIAPFTDESLYTEQFSKANFWYQHSFHGVDLTGLRQAAIDEYFKQPIVDTFDIRICMARSHKYTVNFLTADETDLHNIEIPITFTIQQAGTCHGLAFWFDVAFIGNAATVWLSTTPTQPLTHWYQVRCLLENPIFVKQGQTLTGKVVLRCNNRQSYDVDIELTVPGSSSKSSNVLDLKNPFFRYTGQTPSAPPGTNYASPSDAYWTNTDPTGQIDAQMYLADLQMQQGSGHNHLVPLDGSGNMMPSDQNQWGHRSPAAQDGNQHVKCDSSYLRDWDLNPQMLEKASVAPINPGSIPAATIVNNASQQTRTSIGAGISPSLFSQISSGNNYPISNQFMIGDYAAGSMMLPTQGLGNISYKNSNNL